MPTKKKQSIDDLRAEIRALTGRDSESSDPDYLRRRIAQLRRSDNVARVVTPSVQMSTEFYEATRRIAERDAMSFGQLVRAAIAEYAKRHHHAEAESLQEAAS